jgi:hypothetical protein
LTVFSQKPAAFRDHDRGRMAPVARRLLACLALRRRTNCWRL